ncbi:MAG: N-acetyl-gamma-glutamyl-phosphate reductase [Pirellulaceae bacterium]
MTKKVGIIGASGYTALELIRRIIKHPEVELTTLTTRSEDMLHVADVHPSLRGALDLRLIPFNATQFADAVDIAFSCLPHAASASTVAPLLDAGVQVIDLSADYRLNDLDTYAQYYNAEHPDPERVGQVVYGLCELNRDAIRGANVIANPGCYTTASNLPLAPLIRDGLIETSPIVIDSKSGVSGAGKNPKPHLHFPEANESVSAYGIGVHRHKPEIDEVLGEFAGSEVDVVFTPHLMPMERGILATNYVKPKANVANLVEALESQYEKEAFVYVVDALPSTRDIVNTNRCHIAVRQAGDWCVIVSVLDNLVKGASGQAIQNMNIANDWCETTSLL